MNIFQVLTKNGHQYHALTNVTFDL